MKLIFLSLMALMLALACTTTIKTQKEEKEVREIPSYMTKEEVMSGIEKPLTLRDYSEQAQLIEKDEKIIARKSNLVPLDELFKGLPERKKQLKARREQAIDLSTLPQDVDLRKWATPVKSQWNGTCSTFGLIATEELAQCKVRGECGLDLSERHFWSLYQEYSAPTALDYSSSLVVTENIWPQSQTWKPSNVKKFAKYSVTEHEYLGGDTQLAKNKVLKALADGYPVYFWSQTPSCMLSGRKTCGAKDNGFEDGGHAYSVVGYFNKDNPVLIIKNSWGEDNGDLGYQYLSFKIYDNSDYWEAASIKNVASKDGVPTPPKVTTKCENRWSIKHFWTKKEYCWEEEV